MLRFHANTEYVYIVDSHMYANNKKGTNVLLGFHANSGYGTYGSVTLYRITKARLHTIIILILIFLPRQKMVRRAHVSGVLHVLYIACLAEFVVFRSLNR